MPRSGQSWTSASSGGPGSQHHGRMLVLLPSFPWFPTNCGQGKGEQLLLCQLLPSLASPHCKPSQSSTDSTECVTALLFVPLGPRKGVNKNARSHKENVDQTSPMATAEPPLPRTQMSPWALLGLEFLLQPPSSLQRRQQPCKAQESGQEPGLGQGGQALSQHGASSTRLMGCWGIQSSLLQAAVSAKCQHRLRKAAPWKQKQESDPAAPTRSWAQVTLPTGRKRGERASDVLSPQHCWLWSTQNKCGWSPWWVGRGWLQVGCCCRSPAHPHTSSFSLPHHQHPLTSRIPFSLLWALLHLNRQRWGATGHGLEMPWETEVWERYCGFAMELSETEPDTVQICKA